MKACASALVLAAVGLTAAWIPVRAAPKNAFSVGGEAVYITDGSGKTLFAENADRRREVASIQKLVTALVITRAGNLDKPVTITAADANCSPTKLPNSVGGTYTRRQLLQAMLVMSANDAARALARDNAGSEAAFGAKMTQMARSLGAKNSVFKTSSGLSAGGQHSTARDMAIIGRAAYRDPLIRQTARMKFLPWRDAKGKSHSLRNSNRVLHRHPNATGLKIGYTGAAGHCLVLSWEEAGRTIICVVLGGKNELFWVEAALITSLYANGLL
ncbi:MAG: D-alanyl-D-alanine carboxypeptidase family protein [Chthoniobacterales bacterium]|jgi:D-alanyl-D-alanine carboxypeptidase (penicillin-binding protein 5/6)